ncbi:hypothetical protein P3T16_003552 [Paraburkholderia sp. GAS42]
MRTTQGSRAWRSVSRRQAGPSHRCAAFVRIPTSSPTTRASPAFAYGATSACLSRRRINSTGRTKVDSAKAHRARVSAKRMKTCQLARTRSAPADIRSSAKRRSTCAMSAGRRAARKRRPTLSLRMTVLGTRADLRGWRHGLQRAVVYPARCSVRGTWRCPNISDASCRRSRCFDESELLQSGHAVVQADFFNDPAVF